MRILKNQTILKTQSENYIKGELSNIASVVQAPQILAELYVIDPDQTMTLAGFKNVQDYIDQTSTAVYNMIDNFPMSGFDNLVVQATFNDETGWDEDHESQGIAFPNTHMPKPYDCFIIKGSQVTALYVITNIEPVTVRSNPFVGFTFRLLSRDPGMIAQLRRQVKDEYTTTVTSIGLDKSLVITKAAYSSIEEHVKNYLDLASLYRTLFWDQQKSAFIFDGLYDPETRVKEIFIDMTLWRLMFDEGIVIFDDVVTYANSNFKRTVPRLYTSCPDVMVDDYAFHRSIIWRIYTRDHKNPVDEFRFPQAYSADRRIAKFTGLNLTYFESYGNTSDCNQVSMTCPVWDDEFMHRLKHNEPYDVEAREFRYCDGCYLHCKGKLVNPFNASLRNAIIAWYNEQEIDWENLEISDVKTSENYFLIPLVLAAYKQYIHDLQK